MVTPPLPADNSQGRYMHTQLPAFRAGRDIADSSPENAMMDSMSDKQLVECCR